METFLKEGHPVTTCGCFVVGLFWLALSVFFLAGANAADDQAARYQQAPNCQPGQKVDCHGHGPVTVVQVKEESFLGSTSHYVTVRLREGMTAEIKEATGDLYPYLRAEMVVQAEYWEGKVVALQDAAGHRLTGFDHPTWAQHNNTLGIYAGAIGALFCFILVGWMWRGGRRIHRAYRDEW